MKEYHKIQSVFKRNPDNNYRTFLSEYAEDSFAYLADLMWVGTEKIDGTNMRLHVDEGIVQIGGRTDKAQIPADLYAVMQVMGEMLGEDYWGLTFYGEGYGAGIQKGGGDYRDDQGFILFDILAGDIWLRREDVAAIAEDFDWLVAPMMFVGTLPEAVIAVRDGLISMAGFRDAEGLVLRPTCELRDRRGQRVITKLKTKDFR